MKNTVQGDVMADTTAMDGNDGSSGIEGVVNGNSRNTQEMGTQPVVDSRLLQF